jgi:hypothetical protein
MLIAQGHLEPIPRTSTGKRSDRAGQRKSRTMVNADRAATASSELLNLGRTLAMETLGIAGAPGEIRTPYPLVRSQVLYPNELRTH